MTNGKYFEEITEFIMFIKIKNIASEEINHISDRNN